MTQITTWFGNKREKFISFDFSLHGEVFRKVLKEIVGQLLFVCSGGNSSADVLEID
jgi:hypothetical protein